MKFILQYPQANGLERDMLDAGDVGEMAAAAEKAGFDGFSLTEHPIPGAKWLAQGGHQSVDPFVALAFAAAATTRLRLLTYLAVVPYRNPFLLAKASATLDRMSNGRFVLGVGSGYHKTEFFALGVDFEERNALFDEALEVLPLAWSGEAFSYKGRHFEARNVIQLPRPTQQPIPIWIGAGRTDPIVPPEHGERLATLFRSGGAEVALDWREAGHHLVPEEVAAIAQWLGPA